jgi:hypothetical protein
MNQQKFKEAIFENKETIKNRFAKVYNYKKLMQKFLAEFKDIDFKTFCKLSIKERQEIVEKVFGVPELTFNTIIRDELEKSNKLIEKRLKTKLKEE